MSGRKIAVIGAGLAGLSCAARLSAAGHTVAVLDKGRSVGGRMATRREEACSWDHGAQYFTRRDPAFVALVERAAAAGHAARWMPRWPGGEQESSELWVGTPGQSALPRFLATGLDVRAGTRIVALRRERSTWVLEDDRAGRHGPFDFLVSAVPAPQAAALAAGHSTLAPKIAAVPMAPCWAVLVAFDRPLAIPLDADWQDDAVLPWIARNGSKPQRRGLEAWVLHASAAWSREHLEDPPANVRDRLLDAFAGRLGVAGLPPMSAAAAHRWRHARVEAPLGEPFLVDAAAGIGFCGDWCLDARVEAAYLSGDGLGAHLAASLERA
ncbi:MAG: hypothetical protein AMJ58_00940 [Gammaproteobacteria bacterium SG8_30]|nr:MAG: hypothetical protein AMJ58_00940 [Gammaproteobacteria bacterium SG8_30]